VRALRESVWAEVALGAAVLGVTALLVSTVPARQSVSPVFSSRAVARDTEDRTLDVQVEIDPARVGAQSVRVTTSAPGSGSPVRPVSVEASLEETGRGVGPVRVTLTPAGDGVSTGEVAVPVAGTWTMTLQVSTDPLTTYTAVVRYDVT
jgi:copper transport protein